MRRKPRVVLQNRLFRFFLKFLRLPPLDLGQRPFAGGGGCPYVKLLFDGAKCTRFTET
jgi:hypothetical protein